MKSMNYMPNKLSAHSVLSAKIKESRTALGHDFIITTDQLRKFVDVCSLECHERLTEFGGLEKLLRFLKTSEAYGLPTDETELNQRRATFGSNSIPPKPPIPFWKYALEAMSDPILIILQISALLLLILNLIPIPHKSGKPAGPSYEWVEAIGIEIAVIIVVLVTAVNDHKREAQFRLLQMKIDQEHVFSTLRDGSLQLVKIADLVVGDICFIKYGDVVPADGLLLTCNDIKVDESSLTGESDLVSKSLESDHVLLSGTQIMEGSGKFVIVAVGLNSQAGMILKLLGATAAVVVNQKTSKSTCKVRSEMVSPSPLRAASPASNDETTKASQAAPKTQEGAQPMTLPSEEDGKNNSILQVKLTKMAVVIGYIGLIGASFTVIIPTIKYCIEVYGVKKQPFHLEHMTVFIHFLINGVALLAVCIPEGLPLAIAITLAYSVKKMLKDNNLVRHLDACETMGNATCICSDKTGTLTLNRMTVVQSFMLDSLWSSTPKKGDLPEYFLEILSKSIAVNTNYSTKVKKIDDLWQHIGNKTECALLTFLEKIGVSFEEVRRIHPESNFVKVYTFNSVRKCMATVIPTEDGHQTLCKGAPEIILPKCSTYFSKAGTIQNLSGIKRIQLMRNVVDLMGKNSLRTLAVAYSDTNDPDVNWQDENSVLANMTLVGIFGIEDPVRPEVPDAIMTCQKAGIRVIMVTGDNVQTATSIAIKCGILKVNETNAVIDGSTFNATILDHNSQYSQALFDKLWPRIKVLARVSPQDKFVLVQGIINSRISDMREVVAVTGDGTNDGPALRKADVGFAMGIGGTDVAKEASDIILTDDNFNSIVKAVLWGRNVYDNISKFIQFQLTVNLVASIIAIYGCVVLGFSPLRTIQMLWINLIMDTLASLSLATELPTDALLNRKPYGRKKSLLSSQMIKFIFGHGTMQLIVLMVIIYKGPKLFAINDGIVTTGMDSDPSQHATIVFNSFVLMTLFNEINARRVHGEKNVFKGLSRNTIFCGIWLGSLTLQIIFVQVIPTIPGKGASNLVFTVPLTISQWGWCLFLGVSVLAWGLVLNSIDPALLMPKRKKVKATYTYDEDPVQMDGKVLWLRGFNRVKTQMRVIETMRQCIDINKDIAARIASMIDVDESGIRSPKTASEVGLHTLIQKRKSVQSQKSGIVSPSSPVPDKYETSDSSKEYHSDGSNIANIISLFFRGHVAHHLTY